MTLSFASWRRADVLRNKLILASAVGTSLFVDLPYTCNLITRLGLSASLAAMRRRERGFRRARPFSRIEMQTGDGPVGDADRFDREDPISRSFPSHAVDIKGVFNYISDYHLLLYR